MTITSSQVLDTFYKDQHMEDNKGVIGYDPSTKEDALILADRFQLDFLVVLDQLRASR